KGGEADGARFLYDVGAADEADLLLGEDLAAQAKAGRGMPEKSEINAPLGEPLLHDDAGALADLQAEMGEFALDALDHLGHDDRPERGRHADDDGALGCAAQ